ncbi:MAG: sulfotransferase [Cyanobacteriota bacterium]|nr:sulfotransferase [Cyanobacteriota bacterium]
MKLPTFLIIGIEKSGTTSIYNYLKQHPQVYMSPIKETNFLEREWEDVDNPNPRKIRTFEAYCNLFKDATDEIAIGEASPNYLFHYKKSSERIERYVPNVKTIAILRDPVQRAYSDYLMHLRDAINVGKVSSLYEQAKFKSDTSFTIRKGFYYEPVKYYFDKFGRERVKIYLYKDLCRDSAALMQDIYGYIGVDDSFAVDTSKKAQKAAVPKNQFLNRLLKTKNPLRSAIASGLKLVTTEKMREKMRSNIMSLNSKGKEAVPLTPEETKILRELYREDILKLQDLLQRDLSSWLS